MGLLKKKIPSYTNSCILLKLKYNNFLSKNNYTPSDETASPIPRISSHTMKDLTRFKKKKNENLQFRQKNSRLDTSGDFHRNESIKKKQRKKEEKKKMVVQLPPNEVASSKYKRCKHACIYTSVIRSSGE